MPAACAAAVGLLMSAASAAAVGLPAVASIDEAAPIYARLSLWGSLLFVRIIR